MPASPTLSDEAAQAIKVAFPNATIGAAKLNMDRGLQVYYVELTGDRSVSSVEVTATAPAMVIQAALKLEQKDLPAAIAEAAVVQGAEPPPRWSAPSPLLLSPRRLSYRGRPSRASKSWTSAPISRRGSFSSRPSITSSSRSPPPSPRMM